MKLTSMEICICLIIALIFVCCFGIVYEEHTQKPAAYQAWVKLTGNRKQITFQEWKLLIKTDSLDKGTK